MGMLLISGQKVAKSVKLGMCRDCVLVSVNYCL